MRPASLRKHSVSSLFIRFALILFAAVATPVTFAAHVAVPMAAGERIALDGRLDDPVWLRAPVHSDFWQTDPPLADGPRAASIGTTVQFAFDTHAMYVGVRAFDPEPQRIEAPFVRYDKVFRDQDFVVVYIDAIGAGKAAQWFRVSARGAIADGTHTAANDFEDFAPDFEWDAAAAIDEGGYTVEMRIPFSTLRFPQQQSAPWRVMLGRRMPREQTLLFLSVPLRRDQSSFIAAIEPLQGLERAPAAASLQLTPTLTVRRVDERPQQLSHRNQVDPGIDVKWRPRADWVLDATINPDFSQVELDIPQLSGNRRFALLLIEKRPFFLESSDLFELPTDALYSRAITDPKWGARATYRGARLGGTLLSTRDDGGGFVLLPGPFSTALASQPPSRASNGRLRWGDADLALGLVATDRSYEDAGFNRTIGPDLVWQVSGHDKLRAQVLGSSSTALDDGVGGLRRGDEQNGTLLEASWRRQLSISEMNLRVSRIGDGFRNDNGFHAQSGFRRVNGDINYKWFEASPFNEVTPFLTAAQSVALNGGATIARDLIPGLFIGGARGLELELQWQGLRHERVSTTGPLHQPRRVFLRATGSPSRWWTLATVTVEHGERIDVTADRVRDGSVLFAEGRLRLHPRLELEPRYERAWLRGDTTRRVLDESAARMLADAHFSPRDSLRLIVQRGAAVRIDEGSISGFSEARRIGSLIYAHRQAAGRVVFVGATQARSSDGSRADEWFGKMQWRL